LVARTDIQRTAKILTALAVEAQKKQE